ncbi:MAG TPA: NADH-quinone oxidoreductase subunit J [Chloroflexota bacterium]|nr:NADH-quinone oxidoreductase subunit J [Chloroflexota bacterium]
MQDLFFAATIVAALTIAGALGVVLARRPVHAALALLFHTLGLAGLFLILSSELVAMGQIVIYSGAIVVLFLFVVALLPTGGFEGALGSGRAVAALVMVAILLGTFGAVIGAGAPSATAETDHSVESVGRVLFGPLIVPFELTAPLLLVATVGAVVIWRRQERAR